MENMHRVSVGYIIIVVKDNKFCAVIRVNSFAELAETQTNIWGPIEVTIVILSLLRLETKEILWSKLWSWNFNKRAADLHSLQGNINSVVIPFTTKSLSKLTHNRWAAANYI